MVNLLYYLYVNTFVKLHSSKIMKAKISLIKSIVIGSLLLSSCGTIIGGSKYNAHITVVNNPNAQIVYKGVVRGTGNAFIKVNRNEANQFTFTVKEEGCKEQTYHYTSRTFRGWASAGSLIFTAFRSGIPLPWGIGIDLATGALWKPSIWEKGIFKDNYKNYRYEVNYTNCERIKKETEQQTMLDVVYLKNGSIIKGLILEQIINVQVKLQTKDGNIFVYKYEEIEKITKELSK